MSSVRHFYFFICLSVLFFISLQSDDENPNESPESSTKITEEDTKSQPNQCIKNLTEVEGKLKKTFGELKTKVIKNYLHEKYGLEENWPANPPLNKIDIQRRGLQCSEACSSCKARVHVPPDCLSNEATQIHRKRKTLNYN